MLIFLLQNSFFEVTSFCTLTFLMLVELIWELLVSAALHLIILDETNELYLWEGLSVTEYAKLFPFFEFQSVCCLVTLIKTNLAEYTVS